jgi:hypothetical protein
MIVDDPYRQVVLFKPIHPDSLAWFDRDDYGNCRGYVIQEARPNPEVALNYGLPTMSVYTEECVKVGQSVRYTTYLDGEPYDWRDYPDATPVSRRFGASWVEEYGFVPLVLAQHRDIGLGWGMAEMYPTLCKIHELDDVGSKLDDGIRKNVDPRYLFSGVAPGETLSFGDSTDPDVDGSAQRNALDGLRATDPNAKAQSLIAYLDVTATTNRIKMILENIEREHPELSSDMAGQNASGKARRIAQERVEALVIQRRVSYDDALVRAQSMAISIGAIKGYPGYEAFDAGSYDRGDLEHSIGDRPVFAMDELDRIEQSTGRSLVLKTLTDAGVPLAEAMEIAGYNPDIIARSVAGANVMAQQAVTKQRAVLLGAGAATMGAVQ